ncbi:four helix bundle protein [Candidatus Shapirobacteria bacterium]|nr:four helix bundle protein [Candidatus Shapirobacteria bacterium]
MYEYKKKIKSFTDLIVWQKGHQLVLLVYRLTKTFPKTEQFGLTSQIRRAVVSVTSNIAEGFGRQNKKEKTQFYYLSRGSLIELQNQILIAKDVGYLEKEEFSQTVKLSIEVHKLINRLISSNKL